MLTLTKFALAFACVLLAFSTVEAKTGDYSHTCSCASWNNSVCAKWSCAGNFELNEAKCFPEDATVLVDMHTGTTKLMKDLRIGDQVVGWDFAANEPVVDSVYTFIHRFVDVQANMLELLLTGVDASSKLVASPEHLLFACDGSAVLSEDLKQGDQVRTANGCYTVESVNKVERRGMYAPATHTGTVIVNGVVASNYAVVDTHTWAHLSFAPLRAWSNLRSLFSTTEVSTEECVGIHPYAKMLMGVYGVEEASQVNSVSYVAEGSPQTGFKLQGAASSASSSQQKQKNDEEFMLLMLMAIQRTVFSF